MARTVGLGALTHCSWDYAALACAGGALRRSTVGAMSDDLAGRQLGGFVLTEALGAGAHGSVWRARQVRLDRDVAIKILDPVVGRDPETARRFEREGRAAASLDHPNVVPVYEAGEQDGLVFLAMRLVDGPTLAQHLTEHGPLSGEDTVRLLGPVAEALDHAHQRGLVHRDVKPSNILLEDDRVWLADFGIAASVRELGTYTTGALGTAEYMAPEQANAADVDHRADLYGLACVAYAALVGHPPFPGTDLISTLMAHVNEPVPATGDAQRDAFFAKALAKNPEDRFDSGADLIAGLQTACAVRPPTSALNPVAARSDGGRIGAATHRESLDGKPGGRRWLVAVGALAVLVLVGVVIAITGGGDRGADSDLETAGTPVPSPDADAAAGEEDDASAAPPAEADEPTDGEEGTALDPNEEPTVGSTAELQPGGTVEVGTTRSLRSVNPHVDRLVEPFISTHVLPTLMTVNSDWTWSPSLAAEPPTVVSDSPLTLRWTLRNDAVWDDGTPVTATDVERTLDYINDPSSGATGVLLYQGAELRVIDDLTFEVSFNEPIGGYEVLFSTVHPVIKAAAYDAHIGGGESPATFLEDGIGFSAGPYVVSGFDSEERLTLVRNDAYWAEPALLDRITVRSYDSARAQLDALESGELDLAYVEDARATDAARARSFEDVSVDVGVADQFLRLEMNTRKEPLGDLEVRLAVAEALDRALIAESAVTPITGEIAGPLESLVWPGTYGGNGNPFDRYRGEPAAAETLLQEAGWELQGNERFKDGQRLEVSLKSLEGAPLSEQTLVQSLVVQLLDVGIRVEATVHSDDELFADRQAGEFDLVVAQDVVNADPVAAVFRFGSSYCPASFGVSGCSSDIASNLTGISDAELDDLLAQTSLATTTEERDRLFGEVDARLAEVVPALPLYELPTFVANSVRLGGVVVDTHRGGPFAGMAGWGFVAPPELE